jgi:hypothetical protein
MGKHESSVNFENLIKDLADMYPFDIGTVVLIELVANALDSKATLINIDYHPQERSLVVTDNGTGMTQEEFDQYHDFAAGLKTRGMGIGFAGVGAKISFNIASRVITETRSPSYAAGSNWYLESKKSLIWEDIIPSHLVNHGTRVNVIFRGDVSLPFDDTDSIIALLRQHYLSLLDKHFLSLYSELKYYDINLRFVVNSKHVEPVDIISDYHLDNVHQFYPTSGNKRIGYGVFGLSSKEYPMGENLCGVLLCTHGKVIKADLFNQFPGDIGARIMGLVEIPDFVHFLTSSKTDFIRRKKLREFEKLYNPVRQEFRSWLKELGVQSPEITSRGEAIRLEREIRKLIDDIPELGEFFGFRMPKQVLQNQATGDTLANIQEGAEVTFPIGEGESQGGEAPLDVGDGPGEALVENSEKGNIRAKPISRTGRRGPKIAFNESPDRVDLAWVDGNNIVINSGHPAYRKVISNTTANRLHCIYAVANAVQKFLFSGQTEDLMFSDKMMSAWGKK